ncbi:MAG TPA: electron transfer flavoprotein subunit alpha/FixB family protein [Candidatus Bathyarchaeota archaeon]|nr:electron transfer flavoprotein subunit alpha/FixB family protein [Candidatus Bathyarchaeota archaeon]
MVGPIFVLAEHRAGELRDITFEMLTKGHELAEGLGTELVAILLGHEVDGMAQELAKWANRVLYVSDPLLKNFNADAYQAVLAHLIGERKPILTMIGHTAYGIDVAPSLAVQLGLPIATDCLDLCFEDGRLCVVRQVYGGKVNVRARLKEASSYIVTVRQAAFQPGEYGPLSGEVERVECPIKEEPKGRKFIGIVTPPPGAVDITAADVIVSVGRGIRDKENIPMIEELAELLGGVVACSRPIVDKGWLPKDRQVGSSGKTVKPKLYLAIGISGAFQHVVGMKDSELIIAINKDPKAPIFRFSDYGIVDDLFKVVPELIKQLKEIKGQA